MTGLGKHSLDDVLTALVLGVGYYVSVTVRYDETVVVVGLLV